MAAVERAAAGARGRRCSSAVSSGPVDDVGDPEPAGAAVRSSNGDAGVVGHAGRGAVHDAVGCRAAAPSSLSNAEASTRASRMPGGQVVRQGSGAVDVDVDHDEVVGAEVQQRVTDGGARSAGPSSTTFAVGGVGQPLGEPGGEAGGVGVVADRPVRRRRPRC